MASWGQRLSVAPATGWLPKRRSLPKHRTSEVVEAKEVLPLVEQKGTSVDADDVDQEARSDWLKGLGKRRPLVPQQGRAASLADTPPGSCPLASLYSVATPNSRERIALLREAQREHEERARMLSEDILSADREYRDPAKRRRIRCA